MLAGEQRCGLGEREVGEATAVARGQSAVFRPNLFLLGAAKCATTSVHAALARHPEICMSNPKEPYFFECQFARGVEFYLETYYSSWAGEAVVGEARHRNLYLPYVPERIWQVNSKARLLVLVRNPIDRAHSNWWNNFRRGIEPLGFDAALREDLARIRAGLTVSQPDEIERYCNAISDPEREGHGIY